MISNKAWGDAMGEDEDTQAIIEEIERKKIIKIRQDIEALEGISLRSDSEER